MFGHYTKHNNWNYYPPSESTMIKIMESYAKEIAEAQKAAVLNQFAKDWKWAEIHPKAVECVKNTPLVTP